MPSGTGAVNLRNLPNVPYEVNPAKFFGLTEKNTFNPTSFSLPGSATQANEIQLLQVGVVSKINVLVLGTATTTGATVTGTALYKWPYGLFSSVIVSGNGQNNFISCDSYDLYLRQLIQYRAFVDGYTSSTLSSILSSAAAVAFQVQWEIPIAMDETTLIGSLYAQSEATNLTLSFTQAGNSKLVSMSAGSIDFTGTVYLQEEFFDVPYAPDKPGTIVIPDLTVLHGLIGNNNPATQAEVITPLYRINGQLERLMFYDDNNASLALSEEYIQIRLVYGASQTPQNYNPSDQLRIQNNIDYRDIIPDGTWCIDLVKDNPARDQILLEGVTNLRLVTDFESDFTPNAASFMHFVQETLFA